MPSPEKQSLGSTYITILYRGPSMNPLLRDGDLIYLRSCVEKEMRVGDIVVFDDLETGDAIAHRITSIDSCGIKTKGDNNDEEDFPRIKPHAIRGKVEYAARGQRLFPVSGGCIGLLIARLLTIRKFLLSAAVSTFRPIYRMGSLSGIFASLIPQRIRPRIVRFTRAQGVQMRLMMGKRVIGVLPAGKSDWIIKPPFRLFVNESSLQGLGMRSADVRSNE